MNKQVEAICAEIERRKEFHKTLATAAAEKNLHNTMEANELLVHQYESLLTFLDSLPDEQPSKDLDNEIHSFFEEYIDVHDAKIYGVDERVIPVICYELTARHFYELGQASVRMPEQPSKDLEEAAEKSAISQYKMTTDVDEAMQVISARIFHEIGFKAGAQWQKEQPSKGLKLTADDIGAILELYLQMLRDKKYRNIGRDAICDEVLKRFYELDGNENKEIHG